MWSNTRILDGKMFPYKVFWLMRFATRSHSLFRELHLLLIVLSTFMRLSVTSPTISIKTKTWQVITYDFSPMHTFPCQIKPSSHISRVSKVESGHMFKALIKKLKLKWRKTISSDKLEPILLLGDLGWVIVSFLSIWILKLLKSSSLLC